jgi:probable HAF family extracellular repeat protein
VFSSIAVDGEITVQDLGVLEGYLDCRPQAISDAGHVVGWCRHSTALQRAFLWTAETGILDLGTLGSHSIAWGVNAAGDITGVSWDGPARAVIWPPETGLEIRSLPLFAAKRSETSEGRAINADGQVAGSANKCHTPDCACQPFDGRDCFGASTAVATLWLAGREPIELSASLPRFGKDEPVIEMSSAAHGVNDRGDAVGRVWIRHAAFAPGGPAITALPVLWPAGGGVVQLGPGHGIAVSINTHQWVVGAAAGGLFLWTPSDGLMSIEAHINSVKDINDLGQVIGGTTAALLWTAENGVMRLPALEPGWDSQGQALNNCGQATGTSGPAGGGDLRAVLWNLPVPTAESRTLALNDMVEQLVADGELSVAQSRPLHAVLDGTLRHLEREDDMSAARMLGLFTQHVERMMGTRNTSLDPERGRLLIRRAELIAVLFLSGSRPSCPS